MADFEIINSNDALESTSRNKINNNFAKAVNKQNTGNDVNDPTSPQDVATKNYIDTLGRDGLINPNFTTPLYVSETSFTVAGDVTSWLRPGRGLVITFQTSGIKRGTVVSLSYSSGTDKTTINTIGDSLVNETITGILLSLSDLEATFGLSKARAYRSDSVQTIPNNTDTKVQLNAKNYDTQNEFDAVTNYRFTAKKSGYYLVIGSIFWGSSVDQVWHVIYIYKNGSPSSSQFSRSSGTDDFSQLVSDIIYLAVNDYVELYCYQNTGGNVNINKNSDLTYMAINRLSA